jgi:hypothetical protein
LQYLNKRIRCGTICCAIGWAPKIFPETVSWAFEEEDFTGNSDTMLYDDGCPGGPRAMGYVTLAGELFDIDFDIADALFTPEHNEYSADEQPETHQLMSFIAAEGLRCHGDASPDNLADLLERVLEEWQEERFPTELMYALGEAS